jgi:hypothetical protein
MRSAAAAMEASGKNPLIRNAALAHRSPEHLHVVEHPVLCIQVHHGEDLMRQNPQPCPQEVLDHRRRRQHVSPTHPVRQHPQRGLHYLVSLGRSVFACDIANEQ